MKISKKQLEKLQEIDAILMDNNLGIRLVSFDNSFCCLQLHRINSIDPKTFMFFSIQLYFLDTEKFIKSYTSVSDCIKNLTIFKDLFIFKKLGSL